jgi:hypothetical protein
MVAKSNETSPHDLKRDTLSERSPQVAQRLRETLGPVVQSCVGVSSRPATLARALDIDRTLAARTLRALRSTESSQFLHEIPAPGGLRIFLHAAAEHGVPKGLIEAAAGAVQLFERLIDEFPGGRVALDAALGGVNAEIRARSARGASQAIHRSMTSLLGYQADVMLATAIIQPSADGKALDTAYILGKCGARRLRASSPITVFGWRGDAPGTLPEQYRIETIDGLHQPELGSAYLLHDYCTRPTPPLSLFQSNDLYLYTLAESIPRVNDPVTLIGAQVVRNAGPRYQTEDTRFHWETHTPRFPCKVLLADVFVRDDAISDRVPTLTTTLHSIATGAPRPDAPAFHLDDVSIDTSLQLLGSGISKTASSDIPSYTSLLGTVFGRLGWDADRFRGYRCRLQYPVPLVSLTFWFELLQGPENRGA